MIKDALNSLKAHIATLNPYFDNGFGYCVKDNNANAVWAYTDIGKRLVFPEDRIGNYFFMVVDDTIKFSSTQNLSDFGVGKKNQIDTVPCSLIAVVNDADELALLANLRNSLATYKGSVSFVPNSANIVRESVVLSVMRGFDKREIAATLGNLKNQTIVELKLSASVLFIANNCITDVCRKCD